MLKKYLLKVAIIFSVLIGGTFVIACIARLFHSFLLLLGIADTFGADFFAMLFGVILFIVQGIAIALYCDIEEK